MKYKIGFTGKVQEIAAPTVSQRIGAERYHAIKTLEPHPCFVELCVAQVGESTGRVLGKGNVRKRWSEGVVQELAESFRTASLFDAPDLYVNHDDQNAKRRSVGKLFEGRFEAGKAFAFGLVTDRGAKKAVADRRLDTCSIEAAVEFRISEPDIWDVEKIHADQGVAVALADSRQVRPGFEGAGVTVVIQELADDAATRGRGDAAKGEAMDLAEVRGLVERNGWKPDQLFSVEKILSVPQVNDLLQNEITEAQRKAEDLVKAAQAEAAQLREQIQANAARLEQYQIERARLGARPIIEKAPAMKDVPLGAVPYVLKRLPAETLKESDPARLKAALEAEAQQIMAEARADGIVFGAAAAGSAPTTGNPPQPLDSGAPDYTKPEFNELIPAKA